MKIMFFLVAALCCYNSFGQNTIDLDPVSLTSSRTLQRVSETGRSITIINQQQIQKLPIQSFDDLLKYFGSVEIQQRGPAGSQADIVMRGSTFQQVLVLLDGVKINDPITGHFSAYMPILLSQIERIEILKGPAAAIYGTEAVGGVIHIISKTFSTKDTTQKTNMQAAISGGEYGYWQATAMLEKAIKNIRFSVGAQSQNADGQLLRGKNKGYFHNQLFVGNLAWEFAKNWKLMYHSSYDNRDFAAQNFYTTFLSDTATEKVNSFFNHLKIAKQINSSAFELDIAYKKSEDTYWFNDASIPNNNKSSLFNFQLVHRYKKYSNFSLASGLAMDLKKIESNDRGDHTNKNFAAFSTLSYTHQKLAFHPGLRLVHDENFGTELVPQAAISYQVLPKFILKGNAGKAIRSADFTERYNNYNKVLVTGGSIGNPDLTAEKSWSYEFGFDLIAQPFKISGSWFKRHQKDVIDYVNTPYADMPRKNNLSPTGTFALAKNISTVNTSGLEIELVYQKIINKKSKVDFSNSASFLHSSSSEDQPSFYIISHAKTLIQTTIAYSYQPFEIAFTSIFKERMSQKSAAINAAVSKQYWLMNSKISYNSSHFQLFIQINNLGNIQYQDLLGSKMPGSWTTLGISTKF